MKYTYAYKTSDGARHEAEMEADSREAVFATLRGRGIRPIKVIAADGSKANGEGRRVGMRRRVAAGIAVVVLAGGITAGMLLGKGMSPPRPETVPEGGRPNYSEDERAAWEETKGKADAVRQNFRKVFSDLAVKRINAPATVSATKDASSLYWIAKDAESLIGNSREELRKVFSGVAADFPAGGDAIKDAQRLYGECMAELDAAEISISNRKFALALLDGNREKWTLENGEAVFADSRLARMYKYCLEGIDADGATVRWRRDFNTVD